MEFSKLIVVIPTRNRATLAINAVDSVLRQASSNLEIVVSDNSTQENEVTALRDYCKKIEDSRLHYLRPPESLAMSEHWNWAMIQTIESYPASHVVYLTDRCIFIDDVVNELEVILRKFPDKIVSYSNNTLNDSENPVVLNQIMWSGKVFRINTSQVIDSYANLRLSYAIPRVLNCVVPIHILENIREVFGSYFSSNSPDFNFLGKALDTVGDFLYYDKAITIDYGLSRSNGSSVGGILNADATDFLSNLKTTRVSFPTPISDIRIMPNPLIHEYVDIKKKSRSDKFPEFSMEQYLLYLVNRVFDYEDLDMRKKMMKLLNDGLGKNKVLAYRLKGKGKYYLKALAVKFHNILNPSDPYIRSMIFQNTEDALKAARKPLRKPNGKLRLAAYRLGISRPNTAEVVMDLSGK